MKRALTVLGRSQSWLAEQSSLPEETISRIATRSSRNPQIQTVQKIASGLGVSVGWLLGERTAPLTDAEVQVLQDAVDVLESRIAQPTLPSQGNVTPVGRISMHRGRL
jgi:transcriptional regulator with XRE-family HTH domain